MEQVKLETGRLPRVRTATGILDELKAADPNTAITLSYIRRTINSGRVPVVHVGKKKLVNLDLMLEVLGSGIVAPQGQEDAVSGIRQVD